MRKSRMPVYTPSLEILSLLRKHSNLTNGLTKLEYFAGLAMQGLLAGGLSIYSYEKLSKHSVLHAKELLKQLEDENNKG